MDRYAINRLSLQARFNLGRWVQFSAMPIAWLLINPNHLTFLPSAVFFSMFIGAGFYMGSLRCPACGYQVGRKPPMSWMKWRIWSSDKCCQCGHDISHRKP